MTIRRRAVLVLGMHRSGTSLVSALLCTAGLARPKNLLPGNEYNELGHWEPLSVQQLDDEILTQLGADWHSTLTFPLDLLRSTITDAYRDRVREVIRLEFDDSPLFCVKDPRISRLVPLWDPALAQGGIEPSYVITVRQPLEVADSLKHRDGFHWTKSLMLWLRHTLEAERYTRGRQRVFVSYSELLSDWRGVLRRVGERLEIAWPERASKIDLEFELLISPRLRHHNIPAEVLDARGDIAHWISETFRACLLATEGSEETALPIFDRVWSELERADKAFEAIFIAEQAASATARKENNVLAQRLAAQESKAENFRLKNEELAAHVQQLAADLEATSAQSDAMRSGAAASADRLVVLENELVTLRADLHTARQEISAKAALAAELQAQKDRVSAELDSVTSDMQAFVRRQEMAHDEVERLNAEKSQLGSELDRAQAQLKASQLRETAKDAATAELRAQKASVSCELDALKLDIRVLAERYDAVRDDVERLKGKNNELQSQLERARTRLATLQQGEAARETAIARLLAEKDNALTELNGLQSEMKALAGRHESSQHEIERLKAENSERESAVNISRERLARMRQRASAKDALAAQLRAELMEVSAKMDTLEADLRARNHKGQFAQCNVPDVPSIPDMGVPFESQLNTLPTAFNARLYKTPLGLCDIKGWRLEADIRGDERVTPDGTVGVFVHIYYEDIADDIASAISNIPYEFHTYVSTDDERKVRAIEAALAREGIACAAIKVLPNAGQDIGPFLFGFRDEIRRYDLCLRLHSKKTAHQDPAFGSAWRRHIFSSLLGSSEHVAAVVGAFARHSDLGIVMPEHWPGIIEHLRLGADWPRFAELLERLDLFADPELPVEFPSGSMFWFRSCALAPLLALNLTAEDFADSRKGERDFTLAHAIERVFLFSAAKAGMRWACVSVPEEHDSATDSRPDEGAPPIAYEAAPIDNRRHVSDEDLEEIARSGLFDESYYRAQNADVPMNGGPVRHFAEIGAWEGRWPNRLFDPSYYLAHNADVEASGTNPLLHFARYGWREGRRPHPNFDPAFYVERYADVAAAGVNPLRHYLENGEREKRIPVDLEHFLQPAAEPYRAWLDANGRSGTEECRLAGALAAAGDLPRISVIMPVYRPPQRFLEEAVDSVFAQIYSNWELCIHVDGDDDLALHGWLRALASRSDRVKLSIGSDNEGISAATNAAAALATGEFLAFFDQDDLLAPTALAHMALASASNTQADLLYSDDDKISASGERYAPQFKPDWAPILLLSYMYLGHVHMVRRALFTELGGFCRGFEGSQDYDFALRAAEKARAVVHVPEILYHWRAVPGSTAVSGEAKPHSFAAGLRAVQEACERRGIPATPIQPDWAVAAKCGIFSLLFPDDGPKVTIIIPTRNRVDLLKACVESITRSTTYQNYEILIVDNESDDRETLAYIDSCGHRVLRLDSPSGTFNFAYLMNRAVECADSEYVLLLNNDTEVRRGNWLSQMMGYARMPGVGAVGAKLFFPDDTIQHAGIVHGFYGDLAGPAFRNIAAHDFGYLSYAMVGREYSAVTAACMLSKRQTFLDIGGMDEARFGVAYNDVDFCYRLVQAGFSCVYCPEAELTHHEGKSRGFNDNALEVASFRERYRNFRDRWYSPHLTRDNERFSVQPMKYAAPQLTEAPLRVAMFSHNLNPEGAPNSMFELVAGLKAKGHVDPIVIAPEDGTLRAHYDKAGIPVEIIGHPLQDAFDPAVYAERARQLAAVLRQSGAELVYANTAETFWALDAARKARLPAVWNIRESEQWSTYYQGLPRFLQKAAYDSFYSAYRVIFVATSTRDLWSPLNSRLNFTVIQNGLDLERLKARSAGLTRQLARRQLGVREDEIALVLVGTVCERKNQRVLLEAVAKMPVSTAESVRVFVVGDRDSAYSRDLHEDWAALPTQWRDRVRIIRETDQPYLYFNAADVSLCTSVRESYPRVVLEAMALGKPLITTPVFGITEQARENVNALFFEPTDSEALKNAMVRLITDDAMRREFAQGSKILFGGLMQYDDMIARYARLMHEAALSGVVAA